MRHYKFGGFFMYQSRESGGKSPVVAESEKCATIPRPERLKEYPKDYFAEHTADVFLIGPDGQWDLSYPFEELPNTQMIVDDIVGGAKNRLVKLRIC